MDQLNTYIQQARQQGYADDQIRQSLIGAGYTNDQVNSVLGPATLPAFGQPQAVAKAKKKPKLLIVAVCLVVFLVAVVGAAFAFAGHKTSYQSVIQQYVTDVADKNKSAAVALESPALDADLKKKVDITNFYSFCQQTGQLCTPFFKASFLDKATKSYKAYKGLNGVEGHELVYTLKQSLGGAQAGGQGCTSSSTNTLTIGVVPKGNSWLVDWVEPAINASANLCSSSGTQSTSTTPTSTSTSSSSTPNASASSEPSQANIQQATSDINSIQSQLEAYFTGNGFYPSDISYSNFASQGADQNAFNPPAGIHFVYTPTPAGCSTSSQNCQGYSLSGDDTNNKAVTTVLQAEN
jgi:hypothetical protein